jgi:AraC family transcriptional regulator
MVHPIPWEARFQPDAGLVMPNLERSYTARCAVMSVTCLTHMARARRERVSDQIQIVIPGDQAAMHAAYRTADGREQSVQTREHQVTVVPPREPHAVRSARPGDGPADTIIISLDPAFYEQKAREALGSEAPTLIERHAAVDPFMGEVGNALRSELRMQRPPASPYLESLAVVIAIHLARNYCGALAALPHCAGLPPHKLACVQEFIRNHLAAAIRVQQLAAAVHMSTFHFARMFKQTTGQPPHVYLTMRRIEYAKELLRNSNLALIDVAASAGFQTQGHFTGVFHKYAGMTPRVFRLNCRAARF